MVPLLSLNDKKTLYFSVCLGWVWVVSYCLLFLHLLPLICSYPYPPPLFFYQLEQTLQYFILSIIGSVLCLWQGFYFCMTLSNQDLALSTLFFDFSAQSSAHSFATPSFSFLAFYISRFYPLASMSDGDIRFFPFSPLQGLDCSCLKVVGWCSGVVGIVSCVDSFSYLPPDLSVRLYLHHSSCRCCGDFFLVQCQWCCRSFYWMKLFPVVVECWQCWNWWSAPLYPWLVRHIPSLPLPHILGPEDAWKMVGCWRLRWFSWVSCDRVGCLY